MWTVFCRELLLHNNYLRVLPYELGKLFHLQLLGLQGNPLSKEMLSIYNDNNGTAKLLSYMLDNLQGNIAYYYYEAIHHHHIVIKQSTLKYNHITIYR